MFCTLIYNFFNFNLKTKVFVWKVHRKNVPISSTMLQLTLCIDAVVEHFMHSFEARAYGRKMTRHAISQLLDLLMNVLKMHMHVEF